MREKEKVRMSIIKKKRVGMSKKERVRMQV
jgi:hypothetical protein